MQTEWELRFKYAEVEANEILKYSNTIKDVVQMYKVKFDVLGLWGVVSVGKLENK